MGIWEEIKSFLLPQELDIPTLLHTRCEFLDFELKLCFNRFRVGAVGFC